MSIKSLDGYYGYAKPPVPDSQKLAGNSALSEDASHLAGDKTVSTGEAAKKVDLDAAVKKINDFISPAMSNVKFIVHQENHKLVVTMVDASDEKVLRELPNNEVLNLSKSLDKLNGLTGLGIRQSA